MLDNPRQDLHVIANINVQAIFALGTQRLLNNGFNQYDGTSLIPTSWKAVNFSSSDGKDTTTHMGDPASVRITGQAGKTKTLTQTLVLAGIGGHIFQLSYSTKASALPGTGVCQAQVLFYTGTTLKGTKTLPCPTGAIYNWTQATLNFGAPAAYTNLKVVFTFSEASGTVWFDHALLYTDK